jgi:hypothetical protein
VGVQCEIDEPNDEESEKDVDDMIPDKTKSIRIQGPPDIGSRIENSKPLISGEKQKMVGSVPEDYDPLMDNTVQPVGSAEKDFFDRTVQPPEVKAERVIAAANDHIDWSILAGALEGDFEEDFEEGLDDADWDMDMESTRESATTSFVTENSEDFDLDEHEDEPYLQQFSKSPLSFVTRTCRSEVVDSLLAAQGDVKDPRFLKALDVLSSIYASYNPQKNSDDIISKFLNGSWVSLSRPAYGGCLGKNSRGDFLYTLGNMSFDMFKPTNLKCSVQHTLNNVRFACEMDETAAPWSLRREMALFDPDTDKVSPNATLRNYE